MKLTKEELAEGAKPLQSYGLVAVIKEDVCTFPDAERFFLEGEFDFKLECLGKCLQAMRVRRVDRNVAAASAAEDSTGQGATCCRNFSVDRGSQGGAKAAGKSQANMAGPFTYQGDIGLADHHQYGGFGCTHDIAEKRSLFDKASGEVTGFRQDEKALVWAVDG